MGIPASQEIAPPASTRLPTRGPTMYPTPSRAGERSLPIPNTERPNVTPCSIEEPAILRPVCENFNRAAATPPSAISLAPEPPLAPAFSTSAVATPSGNRRSASTMSARLSGMVKRTPRMPPQSAIPIVGRNGNPAQWRRRMRAGRVKITPAASDSPAEAAV